MNIRHDYIGQYFASIEQQSWLYRCLSGVLYLLAVNCWKAKVLMGFLDWIYC